MKNAINNNKGYEWSYSKVAFMLDYEEVVWPMCEAVRAADIWEPQELIQAVLTGEVKTWGKRATKRGIRQLFQVLRNQCKIDKVTLETAAKLYA